jgi:hypothetical protein
MKEPIHLSRFVLCQAMTAKLLNTIKQFSAIILLMVLFSNAGRAQTLLPFTITNTSPFNDAELYVAIVGEDLSKPSQRIWIDCKTGAQLPMSPAYNTVAGPVYGGNKGPGNNGMYANCFTKLSDIPNKTVMLPGIQGCRVFISKGQQLYLYFFGSTGSPSGYTSPSHTDPTDPNQGILYELIELTYDQYGFFGNTSRVDAYKYPIGMELFGNGYYKKAGEMKTHAEIVAAFKASVPAEFQGCVNATTGEITAPSKTAAFADGSIGTMPTPGPYVNYMKPYIDAVWAKYANEDLIFNAGDAGIWKGRVTGEQLALVCQSQAFLGRTGIITRRPTTQEALEGKGVLDKVVQDATTDLLVQAQLCAALNRRVINVTTAIAGQQDWSNPSTYYTAAPCNYYAKFWHQPGISVDQRAYGFAYDDVWDHSSTLHTPQPTKVVVAFGGYQSTCTPTTITPYIASNGGTWQQTSSVTLDAGGAVTFGPQPSNDGSWNWTGPNGFTATTRQVNISNIQTNQAGSYVATYTNTGGCKSTHTFTVTVNSVGVTLYQDCNYTGTAVTLPAGTYTTSQLSAAGVLDNLASSLRIPGGYTVVLYDGDNLTGASLALSSDAACLVSNGFNDRTSSVSITRGTPSGPCSGAVANGDYSYQVATAGSTVTWTFIPLAPIAGSTLSILYIKVGTNGYAGYTMTSSGGNFTYSLPFAGGEAISFYFTYRVGATATERNSSATPHAYTAGTACSVTARVPQVETLESREETSMVNGALYPNPASSELNIATAGWTGGKVTITDLSGMLFFSDTPTSAVIDVSAYPPGIYFVMFSAEKEVLIKRFSKR